MAPNPYAAPSAYGGPHGFGGAPAHPPAMLRGDVLIVQKGAALPGVCMKCGTHENIVRRQAKFAWTPVWARLSVILCTIGGLIAVVITTKRAQLALPLCAPCNARWSGAIGAVVAGVVALVVGILSFGFFDEPAIGAIVFLVSVVGFIALAVGVAKPRMLQVQKSTTTSSS